MRSPGLPINILLLLLLHISITYMQNLDSGRLNWLQSHSENYLPNFKIESSGLLHLSGNEAFFMALIIILQRKVQLAKLQQTKMELSHIKWNTWMKKEKFHGCLVQYPCESPSQWLSFSQVTWFPAKSRVVHGRSNIIFQGRKLAQ